MASSPLKLKDFLQYRGFIHHAPANLLLMVWYFPRESGSCNNVAPLTFCSILLQRLGTLPGFPSEALFGSSAQENFSTADHLALTPRSHFGSHLRFTPGTPPFGESRALGPFGLTGYLSYDNIPKELTDRYLGHLILSDLLKYLTA